MIDPRVNNDHLLGMRAKEWNNPKVKEYIDKLFSNIELIDGWKFVGSSWAEDDQPKTVDDSIVTLDATKDAAKKVEKKKHRKEELKKNIVKVLNVTIKTANEKEIVYPLQIPQLIDSQFFFIGGNLKIPIFQLYDMPIIYRKTESGDLYLKIKTNVLSAIVNLNKESEYTISLFKNTIPFAELICMYHTKEELDAVYETFDKENYQLQKIKTSCDKIYDLYPDKTKLLEKIGEYFTTSSNADKEKKGKIVLFSLKAAYDIDFYAHKFFKQSSLLFELLQSINDGIRLDSDFKNKRIRFFEYVMYSLIKKVYTMIITIKGNRKIKFQIPQTIIVDNCNVSDIVHMNLPLNPVGELASLFQCTLIGPGGFKKEMVPVHLRNLDDSQFGIVCSADTPDRAGCGVVSNFVPSVNITEDGTFSDDVSKIVCSYPISLTPFLSNDDQTRLQMASNQTKQAILLDDAEPPFIKSGMEPLYLDHTTFLHKAKKNGSVIYLDAKFMVVKYVDNTIDVFNIKYRELHSNTIDFIEPVKALNDTFQAGDILAQSRFLQDGELALGKNLLTGITIWKGYNYEDGIVISESVRDKMTSIHSIDLSFDVTPEEVLLSLNGTDDEYLPIPRSGQSLKKGQVYAKVKKIAGEEGLETINMEEHEYMCPTDCLITSIEIYPNSWYTKIPEYNDFIDKIINLQSNKISELKDTLGKFLPEEEVENMITLHGLSRLDCKKQKGKYSEKNKKINGLHINIKAVYKERLSVGDKLANRHGNKGVISYVIPDDQMPYTEDGRRLDIIINPLGVISRMNVGQLYELHILECLNNLKKDMKTHQTVEECIELLNNFLYYMDRQVLSKFDGYNWTTKEIVSKFTKEFDTLGKDAAIDKIRIIMPPFCSVHPKDIDTLMELTKSAYRQKLYDPTVNSYLKNSVSIGHMYFLKLVHRASDKISARSIGPYSRNTLQPLAGKRRGGGLRLGEMEIWSLIAHGATNTVRTLLTVNADSPGLKNKALAEILQNPDLAAYDNSDETPQSLRMFHTYLKSMGLELSD